MGAGKGHLDMVSTRAIVTKSWRPFRLGSGEALLLAFVLAQALDIWSTHVGLAHGAVEVNPVGSRILASFGEPGLYTFKTIAVSAMVLAVARAKSQGRGVRRTLVALTALVSAVVLLNVLNVALTAL